MLALCIERVVMYGLGCYMAFTAMKLYLEEVKNTGCSSLDFNIRQLQQFKV